MPIAAPRTSTSAGSIRPPGGSPAPRTAPFHGLSGAGIAGISEASPHDPITLGEDCERYPTHVAKAVDSLRAVGIDAPYGLALGPEVHTRVLETSEHGGYPLLEHLREILGGPIVWAPAVQGGTVVSMRGGDFLFESGEDLSIGYESHDAETVQLYLEESFSFLAATPEAAVALALARTQGASGPQTLPRSAAQGRRGDARFALDIRNQHREVVHVAPRPVLARLERADQRVAAGPRERWRGGWASCYNTRPFPHSRQIRRCNHGSPVARHSLAAVNRLGELSDLNVI